MMIAVFEYPSTPCQLARWHEKWKYICSEKSLPLKCTLGGCYRLMSYPSKHFKRNSGFKEQLIAINEQH